MGSRSRLQGRNALRPLDITPIQRGTDRMGKHVLRTAWAHHLLQVIGPVIVEIEPGIFRYGFGGLT